jgi:predicted acylesterase/phospholipase RssA
MFWKPAVMNRKSTLNCIGLCFSGGGYRASIFNLGVLSYLNRLNYDGRNMLDRVEVLSTVSGGTFTGLAFAKARLQQDYSFITFYDQFYTTFEPANDRLMDNATAKLIDDEVWKKHPHKKRSVINAMALTYADMEVFKGNFGMFMDTDLGIYQVCFNATDFTFGLPFRFQNKLTFSNGKIKNNLLNKIKNEFPLADILAASSCFPVGFEPMIFPDDFYNNHKNKNYLALKEIELFKKGIGLMDGGITDNQGIGSMINAYESSFFKNKMDLILVSDVSSSKIAVPYQPESEQIKESSKIKMMIGFILNSIKIYGLALFLLVLSISLPILSYYEVRSRCIENLLLMTSGVLLGLGIVTVVLGVVTHRIKDTIIDFIRNQFKKIPKDLQDNVLIFENLEFNLVVKMLKERISSSFLMIYDIFTKQLRRINYDFLYKQNTALNGIVVTSMIHKFNDNFRKYHPLEMGDLKLAEPSVALREVALHASETGTQLWWTQKDKELNRMDKLIATGQFTTCYNLLVHISQLDKKGIDINGLKELKKLLAADWTAFNKNAFMMMP